MGKGKGMESDQCQNLGRKQSISWWAPPKHLLLCLFGEPGGLKPAAFGARVRGVYFSIMSFQQHQDSKLF